MLPGVLPAVDRHYADMRRLEMLALLLLRRAWANVDPTDLFGSWDREVSRLLRTFTGLQLVAAAEGARYTEETLRAQRIRTVPDAEFVPESLVGWASDGRPLETLLRVPALVAQDRLTAGLEPPQALEFGRHSAERIARTQIGDTGRVAAGVSIAARPRVGWTRMLVPPSCARCLILAGRFYPWSAGFDRHPNDDCVHVPTAEDRGDDLRTDPDAYFRSLTAEEQDRLLGKAAAQAVRDGADMNQVVNARRGMTEAGTTTEGITSRGFAGRRLANAGINTRLTPETIYREATSRADALRLLKAHGYIL